MGAVVNLWPKAAVAMTHARCPQPIPYGLADVIERHSNGVPSLIGWQGHLIPLDEQGVERKPTSSFTLRIWGDVHAATAEGKTAGYPVSGEAADDPIPPDDR